MAIPGPAELGRGVVVSPGMDPPEAWVRCPRICVGPETLSDPSAAVTRLERAWLDREPVVIELGVSSQELQERETALGPVHDLDPRFEFSRERLHFLVWANTYDARGADPIWWHGRKAGRRFGEQGVAEADMADIQLADGTLLYVDGGPFAPSPLADGAGVVHRWNTEAGSLSAVGHRPPDADLAPDQLAAVSHASGSARVIAPAGSGKTRVLTERLRHLIGDCGVDPSTVTALAYNRRAADELMERSGSLSTGRRPHIRTLNSMGQWICDTYGGLGRLRVLEEPSVRELIQGVFEVRRQANTDTVLPYIDALSAARLGLTSPTAVEDLIPDAQGFAGGFDSYRAALAEAGAVDFDEQIYQAIEILLRDPEARSAAQGRCRHLLVDEFQDLNAAHMLLIRLLCAPGSSCFGVGDDDQVIYGYAGATPEYLINFADYFPGARNYALEVNYRCPPAVVRAATAVLSYNVDRIVKTISTPDERGDDVGDFAPILGGQGPVAVITARSEELPKAALAAISGWVGGGVPFGEIAVLTRVNSSLLPVQIALAEAGIPSNAPLNGKALERTGVRTALAYLRMGLDPGAIRRDDVQQTIRRPSRGIAPNVAAMATERTTTSVADIRRLANRLSGRDGPKVLAYADAVDAVATACPKSTAAVLRAIRVQVGLGETMDVLDSSRREADRSTHTDDLVALEAVAALHPDAATFEAWLRELLTRPAASGPAVLLSTIHKIKGREWEHVIVYGASAGLLPHRLSEDAEGERRVFHVALTRAIRQVVVLADAEAPSPFVAELDGSRARQPLGLSGAGRRAERDGWRSGGASKEGSGGAVRRSRTGAGAGGGRAAKRPARAMPTAVAEVGLRLTFGGHSGTVVELSDGAAVVAVGEARLRVAFGCEVRVQGATVVLSAPGETAEEASVAEGALRAWRLGVAKREAVPAYVVLNDSELTGIAAARPQTLAELARCKGIGPTRLERWGDELLAVLDGVDDDSNDAGLLVPSAGGDARG